MYIKKQSMIREAVITNTYLEYQMLRGLKKTADWRTV